MFAFVLNFCLSFVLSFTFVLNRQFWIDTWVCLFLIESLECFG